MSEIVLEQASLTLESRAGPVEVLRSVDFVLRRGESVAIVGPSGSGKTSLLMLLAGLERPSGGRARALGADLLTLNEDALARMRLGQIGFVFQSFHLVPTFSALENVAMPLELMGRRDALPRARAELASVGLAHRLEHYPSQLSGGEQQRVALARATVARPRILFADEPTGNLDQQTGNAVAALIFARAGALGASLVLVTHDAALAARCTRQLRMEDGRVTPV